METATPDVNTPVESSTAETAVVEVPRSGADYATWRNTGKLPEPKQPKPEAPASSKETSESDKDENNAPVPETGKPSQEKTKPRDDAANRLKDLLADIKAAGFSGPAELKTFKREAAKTEQATPEKTVNPPEPKTEELRPKPKLEDFKSWDEWQTDLEKWSDEKTERRIAAALHQERQARAQDDLRKQGEEKLAKAMDRYGGDARPKIMDTVKAISEAKLNPALDGMLQSSPVIADLLYAIGSDPEHLATFIQEAKTDPAAAIRRLVLTEDLVKRELAKGSKGEPETPETPERDKSGKFVSEAKQPAKKVTDAPNPSREVGGRAAPPPDDAESAFAADDAGSIARIMRARNQRDVAKHKGM